MRIKIEIETRLKFSKVFFSIIILNFRECDCLMGKWNRLMFSELVLNFFLDYYLLNFRECDSLMEKWNRLTFSEVVLNFFL